MRNSNLRKNKVLNAIVIFALFFLQSNFSYAGGDGTGSNLPYGESTVSGSTSVGVTGTTMTVNTTANSINNWKGFGIGNGFTVDINIAGGGRSLERVTGINPSLIYGILNSNGTVLLVNRNGILFGPNSQVNANALVASTLDISNSDFLAGKYNFHQKGKSAWIINQGHIHVCNGGYVLLLSNAINNSGVIEAKLGRVLLAAGEKLTVALDDDSDISVTINDAVSHGVFGPDGAKMTSAIQNSGSILADGGAILLNAKILNGIFDNAVNNSGVIQANSLVNNNGSIQIVADGGNVVLSSGSLTSAKASDNTAEGGNISINSTNDTDVQSGATIDVSGGSVSGNGGSVDISAQGDVNFDGTLNGQAASGYNLGSFTIDLTNANISGFILGNTTVWATNNITITGNIYDLLGATLNLYADHNSKAAGNWNNVSGGAGTITETGNYTIYGLLPADLNLEAGGGIGTLADPIHVSDISDISALINPNFGMGSGGIYIKDTGIIYPLTITKAATDGGDIGITSNTSINANNINSHGGVVGLTAKYNIVAQNITGGNVDLTAGTGINANNLKSFSNVLNAGGNINANGVFAVSNSLTAGGNIDASNIHGTNNYLTATGSIDASDVYATNNYLSAGLDIDASAFGAVNDYLNATHNANVSDISGNNLYLTAGWDIKAKDISSGANYFSAGHNIGAKDISGGGNYLTAGGDIYANGINGYATKLTAGRNIDARHILGTDIVLKANRNITATGIIGNNIDITAGKNVIVGYINAGHNGIVYIKSLFGYIEGAWNAFIGGKVIVLDAKKGIGNDRRVIKTDARYIVAKVWGSQGSINLDDVSSRTVTLEYVSTNDGRITIKSNGTIDAKDVQSGGGNIDLTARKNIIVKDVNADWGNVYLKAVTGYIEGTWNSFIGGNLVVLDAKKGIGNGRHAIRMFADNIVAKVWGRHGSINIDDISAGTVTLEYISTNDGRITINSNGYVDAKDIQSRGGNIDLTTKGSIKVGYINAERGNVFLTSVFGYIEGTWRSFIGGNLVVLDAKKGIGSGRHAIKTDARYIVAKVWGHRGSINIDDVNNRTVTLEYVSTNGGKIDIKSNGTIDAKDVKSRGGKIDLTAKKNIIVGKINAGWGDVFLTAVFGYIEGSWKSFINADFVSLDAKKGIGNGRHAIKTDARTIDAKVWGKYGSINIDDVNSHNVTLEYVSTNDGAITINSHGSIFARDVKSRGGDIDLTAVNNIRVKSVNAGTGDATLTATNGSIIGYGNGTNITADSIFLSAGDSIYGHYNPSDLRFSNAGGFGFLTTNASFITATAAERINLYDTGDVTLSYVVTSPLSLGSIDIAASGDISVDYVSDPVDVTLEALNGSIIGLNDTENYSEDVSTENLYLNASDSIYGNYTPAEGVLTYPGNAGEFGFLTTDATTVTAFAESRINLYDLNTVTLADVQTSPESEGSIDIAANGDIDVDYVSDPVDVTLEALSGSIIGLNDSENYSEDIDTQNLSLFASDLIIGGYTPSVYFTNDTGEEGFLTTDATSLTALAVGNRINVYDNNAAGVNLTNVQTSIGSTGTVDVVANGDINVGLVAAPNDVTLESQNGSIQDVNAPIVSNTVDLSAGTDIGSSTTYLPTFSNFLSINAGGNVYLNSTGVEIKNMNVGGSASLVTNDGTILDNITTGGDFTLDALSGDVTLNGILDSTGGAVGILVGDGSIDANPGSQVIANANSYFNTPLGIIGTYADPVNVDVTGNLVLAIGTKVGFSSGFLKGTVTGKGHIPLVTPATYKPLDPPGNIFFNGIRIWPTRFEFALSQGASSLISHFVFPSAEQLVFTQINTFDPSTTSGQTGGLGLFLYHPLEDVDSGAFDQQFQLDEGAYDFIDGEILKKP